MLSAQEERSIEHYAHIDSIPKLWTTAGNELSPTEWQACWIWQKGEITGNNQVLLARKLFNVEAKPEQARLFITADTYYELYVNGRFVNRGPARCAPHHQSYDILDIAATLKVGENVIALRVFHKGQGILNATVTARHGMLAQLEIQSKGMQQIITSDSSWKVKKPEGMNLYTSDFGESKDFRKEEKQWKDVNFDDSQWDKAKELINDTFWPKPSPGEKATTIIYPWLSLVPRDIPYLTESFVKANQLHEVGEILELSYCEPVAAGVHGLIFPKGKNTLSGFEAYKAGEGAITIKNRYPSNTFSSEGIYSTYLIFDLGELMHGYPHLEIEGEAGTIVEILYAPHLLGGKFPLRTKMSGRPFTDKIILGKGKTVWNALEIRDMRYLFIAFRNTEKPVHLNVAGLKRTDYPFETLGSLSVPKDPDTEWLWKASVKTLAAVTTDAYVDNYREKRQYSQTSYYASRANYVAFGDSYLQRRYLVQIAQEQQKNGLFPVKAPKEFMPKVGFDSFLDGSIFWVMGLHDYFLHTGDTSTVRELLPSAASFLDLLRGWENKDGIIESPPYSYWIDHADLDRSGANFSFNALYLLTMHDYMAILKWMGNDEQALEYEKRITKLRLNMRNRFWNTDQKLFSDALVGEKMSAKFTEHSNSLAIVAGIASQEQEEEIVREFVENNSARLVPAVLFMHYITEALFMSRHGNEALSMLKNRYGNMKKDGSQTLWEEWSLSVSKRTGQFEPNLKRTNAQGENTFPAYSLTRWVLGVQPVKPGMTEVILSCNLCGLAEIEGCMPSPNGSIHVAWENSKKGISLEVEVPDGIHVKVDLNSEDIREKKMLSLDGQNFVIEMLGSGTFEIPAGKHILKFY
jgi:hypothetical protein